MARLRGEVVEASWRCEEATASSEFFPSMPASCSPHSEENLGGVASFCASEIQDAGVQRNEFGDFLPLDLAAQAKKTAARRALQQCAGSWRGAAEELELQLRRRQGQDDDDIMSSVASQPDADGIGVGRGKVSFMGSTGSVVSLLGSTSSVVSLRGSASSSSMLRGSSGDTDDFDCASALSSVSNSVTSTVTSSCSTCLVAHQRLEDARPKYTRTAARLELRRRAEHFQAAVGSWNCKLKQTRAARGMIQEGCSYDESAARPTSCDEALVLERLMAECSRLLWSCEESQAQVQPGPVVTKVAVTSSKSLMAERLLLLYLDRRTEEKEVEELRVVRRKDRRCKSWPSASLDAALLGTDLPYLASPPSPDWLRTLSEDEAEAGAAQEAEARCAASASEARAASSCAEGGRVSRASGRRRWQVACGFGGLSLLLLLPLFYALGGLAAARSSLYCPAPRPSAGPVAEVAAFV